MIFQQIMYTLIFGGIAVAICVYFWVAGGRAVKELEKDNRLNS